MTEYGEDHTAEHFRLHGLDSGVNDGIERLGAVEREIEGFDVALRHHVDITVEKFQEHNERLDVQAQNDRQLQEGIASVRADLVTGAQGLAEAFRQVAALEEQARALTLAGSNIVAIVEAIEHRLVVLESRMESVLARLSGHDLGFVTLYTHRHDSEQLAEVIGQGRQGGSDDPIIPDEEGTSRR